VLQTRTDDAGAPLAVQRISWPAPCCVTRVQDRWRIDDEWWREGPIARLYYRVQLDDGTLRTLYHDLPTGAWLEQAY
jgi:hypothetical protein